MYKYNQQAHFCIGVAKVQHMSKETKCKRYGVFDYTGKKILTIEDYQKIIKDEIKRVKVLRFSTNST